MAAAVPADLNRRARRKLALRERILEVSAELFYEQGFHATKVSDVCEHADIAQKTFFNHFPTKQDVLREIARYALSDVLAQIELARKRPGSTTDRLHAFYEELCDRADEAGPMRREMLTEILHVSHESAQPEEARRLQAAFGALLEDGLAAGDIDADADLVGLTELVLGSYYALMFNWAHQDEYPLRERARSQIELIAQLVRLAPVDRKD